MEKTLYKTIQFLIFEKMPIETDEKSVYLQTAFM
jgi:hypothetical protein